MYSYTINAFPKMYSYKINAFPKWDQMYLQADINSICPIFLLHLALPPPFQPSLLLLTLPPPPFAVADAVVVVVIVVALLLLLWSCSGHPILKMDVHLLFAWQCKGLQLTT